MRFTTPPLVRYVDDKPQAYHIDFSTNVQTNAATEYQREIVRKKISIPVHVGNWKFFDGVWKPYETLVQAQIEAAYQAYSDGTGPSTIHITFPGRPEKYGLNFVRGTQQNAVSSEERLVQRM